MSGSNTPKQLIKIAGRTILEHTLALFDGSPDIDEVVVLMAPGFADTVKEIVERGGFDKVSQIVEGGASRPESTWRALKALGPRECNVLLHDAVRPLLEPRIITECVRALQTIRPWTWRSRAPTPSWWRPPDLVARSSATSPTDHGCAAPRRRSASGCR